MKINPNIRPLDRSKPTVLLGSCFSNEVGNKLRRLCYPVSVNPHGTQYNPLSILGVIQNASSEQVDGDLIFRRDEVYAHWHYHSDMSALSKEELIDNIGEANSEIPIREEGVQWVITVGSAWVSVLENGVVAANNHKMPSNFFERRLLTVSEMLEPYVHWINSLPPSHHVYLTISPVRHKREGWVGNNRSKARLIEWAHALCDRFEQVEYIPSYEFVLDELRDRLFFAEDGVHPNDMAVNRLWEVLADWWFSDRDQILNDELSSLLRDIDHRPRFPKSIAYQKHLKSIEVKLNKLRKEGLSLECLEEKLSSLLSS